MEGNRRLMVLLSAASLTAAALACNLPSGVTGVEEQQSGADEGAASDPEGRQSQATATATETEPAPSATPLPSATPIPTSSPTPEPTPFGGGGRIAYSSDRDNEWGDIFAFEMTAAGPGEPTKLTDNNGSYGIDSLDWKPDGSAVTFSLYGVEGGETAIYDISADGEVTATELLYDEQDYYTAPIWSANGERLLYSDFEQKGSNAWLLEPATDERRQVTSDDSYQFATDWMPADAGVLLVEIETLVEGRDYRADLVAMPFDGTPELILANQENLGVARYSPDGNKILFDSRTGSSADIYVMNAEGTGVRQLTDSSELEFDPDWSPDGKHIVYAVRVTDDDADIYVMDADGGNARPVVSGPGWERIPVWGP